MIYRSDIEKILWYPLIFILPSKTDNRRYQGHHKIDKTYNTNIAKPVSLAIALNQPECLRKVLSRPISIPAKSPKFINKYEFSVNPSLFAKTG